MRTDVAPGLRRGLAIGALLALALAPPPSGGALAQGPAPAREAHGALDVYAGQGIALAWAILRDADEKATAVVVRVDADPARYKALSITGVDPFTAATVALTPPTPLSGGYRFHVPRARFADHPRTEWRFYGEAAPARDAAPIVMVYFQGVPDTAPEFDDAAKLDAYLAERLRRARDEARGATR